MISTQRSGRDLRIENKSSSRLLAHNNSMDVLDNVIIDGTFTSVS